MKGPRIFPAKKKSHSPRAPTTIPFEAMNPPNLPASSRALAGALLVLLGCSSPGRGGPTGQGGTGGEGESTGGSAGQPTGGSKGGGSGGSTGGSGGAATPDAAPPPGDAEPVDEPEPTADAGAPSSGDAGAPPASPKTTTPSAACGTGKPAPEQGYHTIQVGALSRKYILRLPSIYDGKKPWPVIFAFHGAGGQDATTFDKGFGFKAANGEKAVLVFGEALPRPQGGRSWMVDTAAGMAYMDAVIDWLKSNVCIDVSRLFATGQSSGGYFSQTLGCQRGHVFRAVAPSSGGIRDFVNCMGNPAVWMSHGVGDSGTSKDVADAKKYWLEHKKCTTMTKPVAPTPCVEYQGCADEVPFVFCEHSGGHPWPPYATNGVWTFFSRF
jgi:polyhydroxybutyrate depolymerase